VCSNSSKYRRRFTATIIATGATAGLFKLVVASLAKDPKRKIAGAGIVNSKNNFKGGHYAIRI
jgi:hypothetical protein